MVHLNAPLTNQHLNDRFRSPFALLAVAIQRVRETVHAGQELPSNGKILNTACQILDQIDDETDGMTCVECDKKYKSNP